MLGLGSSVELWGPLHESSLGGWMRDSLNAHPKSPAAQPGPRARRWERCSTELGDPGPAAGYPQAAYETQHAPELPDHRCCVCYKPVCRRLLGSQCAQGCVGQSLFVPWFSCSGDGWDGAEGGPFSSERWKALKLVVPHHVGVVEMTLP